MFIATGHAFSEYAHTQDLFLLRALMSLVAFTSHGRHKGNTNHFEFITSAHPREPVVNGLTGATSVNQNILWAHSQQLGVLGMENWGQPEVPRIYFRNRKG